MQESPRLTRASLYQRFTKLLCLILLAFLVFISTPLSYLYSLPLREKFGPRKSDAIVLLSSGQIGADWLTLDGSQRTLGALKLYREGFAPIIISSGSQHQAGFRQAELQAQWLGRAGVPSDAVVVEGRSTRTYESALEVTRLLRERGMSSAVIVTSEMDVPRIRLIFAKLGIATSFLAVPEVGKPRSLLYFPAGVLVAYHATYEYSALLLYRFYGWI